MIITCQQCAARLRLDDAKVPTRPFTVRCPKCQHPINAQPSGAPPLAPAEMDEHATLPPAAPRNGESSSPSSSRPARPAPAPAFNLDAPAPHVEMTSPTEATLPAQDEAMRLLSALLQGAMTTSETSNGAARRAWSQRRALVCVDAEYRLTVARALAANNDEVFVAEDTTQAIERMRESRIDVLIIDPAFDQAEQGAAFIKREISSLRPSDRRRVFIVHLSADARTADVHAAFLKHVNLVVNTSDLDELPQTLERAIREFNLLYREFNKALQVADL